MKCTCPKCHEKIEVELPEISEAGTTANCPSCNARFNIFKESFGGRALRKSSEISCAPCGGELGPEAYCPTCGAQFPDYLVVSLGRKRGRRPVAKMKLKSSPFPRSERSAIQLPSLDGSVQAETPRAVKSRPGLPKPAMVAIGVLVAVALAVGGSSYYKKYRTEKEFVRNFVLATYCVQVGTDRNIKAGGQFVSEWKPKVDAGENFRPRLSLSEDRELNIIDGKVDTYSAKLIESPEKFNQCNEKLANLRGVYKRLHLLIITPGNSIQSFADNTTRMDADYRQAAKEFKAGMPAEMMDELIDASKRYKGLAPLLTR